MPEFTINVIAEWDEEAAVWFARSDDVAGLVAEAATADELMEILPDIIKDLVRLNGHPAFSVGSEIPVCFIAPTKKPVRIHAA